MQHPVPMGMRQRLGEAGAHPATRLNEVEIGKQFAIAQGGEIQRGRVAGLCVDDGEDVATRGGAPTRRGGGFSPL